jgi:hypothetical protein
MNTATIAGIIRAILAAAAGYLAGKGIDITGLLTPEATSALALLGVTLWSIFAKKQPAPPTP